MPYVIKVSNAEMHLFDCVGRGLALSTEHPILLPDVWFGHIITKAAGHEGNEVRLYKILYYSSFDGSFTLSQNKYKQINIL